MTRPTGAYAWLNAEPGPRMLLEALKLFGTLEAPGQADSPVILAWGDEVATALGTPYANWVADFYNDDAIPWCGLFMAVCATRANLDKRPDRNPPTKFLAALEWANYGRSVDKADALLGDVLVFGREGGGHVGLYVGEDAAHLHVLGGNTRDSVSIAPLARERLRAVRRTPYLTPPANLRKVRLTAGGPVSTNEA